MVNQQLIHEEYERCKEIFKPSTELFNQKMNICDEEERAFYQLLFDFFLQQRQKDAIKEEKY